MIIVIIIIKYYYYSQWLICFPIKSNGSRLKMSKMLKKLSNNLLKSKTHKCK